MVSAAHSAFCLSIPIMDASFTMPISTPPRRSSPPVRAPKAMAPAPIKGAARRSFGAKRPSRVIAPAATAKTTIILPRPIAREVIVSTAESIDFWSIRYWPARLTSLIRPMPRSTMPPPIRVIAIDPLTMFLRSLPMLIWPNLSMGSCSSSAAPPMATTAAARPPSIPATSSTRPTSSPVFRSRKSPAITRATPRRTAAPAKRAMLAPFFLRLSARSLNLMAPNFCIGS